MRKLIGITVAVTALALVPFALKAGEDPDYKPATEKGVVTLTGAPVDLVCYLDGHSGVGDDSSCAETCIAKNGMPAGILVKEDGKNVIYVALGSNSKKLFGIIGPRMNQWSKITGEVYEIDNLKIIDVEKAEPLE